jgi:hypothetical protein
MGTLMAEITSLRRMNQIDPKLLQRSFEKLTASFPKRFTGLYMSLRTGHAPLNKYLHRIGKAESSQCPHCRQVDETVHHHQEKGYLPFWHI